MKEIKVSESASILCYSTRKRCLKLYSPFRTLSNTAYMSAWPTPRPPHWRGWTQGSRPASGLRWSPRQPIRCQYSRFGPIRGQYYLDTGGTALAWQAEVHTSVQQVGRHLGRTLASDILLHCSVCSVLSFQLHNHNIIAQMVLSSCLSKSEITFYSWGLSMSTSQKQFHAIILYGSA